MRVDIYQRLFDGETAAIDDSITLDHIQREKGRFKVLSDSGMEVGVFLERGHVIQLGEVLRSNCGKNIKVLGAIENVITAYSNDWGVVCRACYHLGNRHVKVQLGELWLRIIADHVLEDMLLKLGLSLQREQTVFLPESGAYLINSGYAAHD